jgi:hypothetical protein
MEHYDIVIATPGSSMKPDYVRSLVKTIKWMDSKGLKYHFVSRYSSFVASARELTAIDQDGNDWETREFGAGKFSYDYILWVDSDVSWEPEVLERLLSHNVDIVGAMCPVNVFGRIGATTLDKDGHPTSMSILDLILEVDLVQVDGLGFGFLLVKKGVFESISRPWFKIREIRVSGAEFPIDMGEDYSWCKNATDSGFQLWLDPLARVDHHKETILTI